MGEISLCNNECYDEYYEFFCVLDVAAMDILWELSTKGQKNGKKCFIQFQENIFSVQTRQSKKQRKKKRELADKRITG